MTQQEALDILKLGYNAYLTGCAGSGKTFLLNRYLAHLKKNGVGVGITASTGIAATHMNGTTVHSWSGLGIRDKVTERDIDFLLKKKQLVGRFEKTAVLVIDEVSMLHAFQLDLIDALCKAFKRSARPFGGMQVVLCGDFFQLPPVSKNSEAPLFVDQSRVWQEMDMRVCYLDEQHRHEDDTLTRVLHDIRTNTVGEHTLEPLRQRYKGTIAGSVEPTKLYTHNVDVDSFNNRELEKLSGETHTYLMSSQGNRKLVELLKKSCLAPEELRLKTGALVMFVKNNVEEGYVNGTLGCVVDFDDENMPLVKTMHGRIIAASPETWRIEEEGKMRAEIRQIPLRLAWAITVHKSQGMTLDAAEIDLSKSFVEGMGYVALSRVRALSGLRLMGLNTIALRVHEKVLERDAPLREASEQHVRNLQTLSAPEKEKQQRDFLRSIARPGQEEPLSTYEKTKLLLDEKLPVTAIANRRGLTEGTIVSHIEKLIERGEKCDLSHFDVTIPSDRLRMIKDAFKKLGDTKLSLVRNLLGEDFSYDELRLVRLLIKDQ
jgi:hypothetical protein